MITKVIRIDELDIYYRVGGNNQKPTLLWLDGLSISKDLKGRMDKTGKFLSSFFDDFYVVSLEYPSFMRSDIPEKEWTIDEYVSLIHKFIMTVKLNKPFVMMGHSFGAMLSYSYASKFSEDVKLLVISAPPITYKFSPFYFRVFDLLENLEDVLFDTKIIPTFIKKSVPKYFMSSSDENLTKYEISKLKLAVKTFTHMARSDYFDKAKLVNTRTIYITGDKDFLVPIRNSIEVVKNIKNCKYFNFNEGHTTLPWQIVKLKSEIIKLST